MRRKILTKFEDIGKVAREISKIKNVKAVYLFGSYAKNKHGALSDIDLCVIGNLDNREKLEVAGYGSDNLDISLFDELPIYIKFRVLKEGRPLIVKDKRFLNFVKVNTMHEYFDFKIMIIDKHVTKTFENV